MNRLTPSTVAGIALAFTACGQMGVSCGGSTPSDDLLIPAPVLTSGYVDDLSRPPICGNQTTPCPS